MEYILIKPVGVINSKKRAQVIARELYNITRPVHLQTPQEKTCRLFGVIQHLTNKDQFALRVDTDHLIDVHDECSLEKLVAMFPELTAAERYDLQAAVHQLDQLPFSAILPSTVTVRDAQYMEANGWIEPYDDE
tara:strand:+ start:1639 stop:2040 length:402 start_codon:yes stop_codon:yes gene_type:complete